ncbi:unnamed protein product [Oikopleura dioica]|uniref:Uncharacterized protein n=1 Tax=Oikopleura dioica TaxID=34765 RepID=E4XKX9_OIKDI|nr:unnamed protein product [Oikopleura dioica]
MNVSKKEEKVAPKNKEIGDYYADTTCLQGDMVNLYLIRHHEKMEKIREMLKEFHVLVKARKSLEATSKLGLVSKLMKELGSGLKSSFDQTRDYHRRVGNRIEEGKKTRTLIGNEIQLAYASSVIDTDLASKRLQDQMDLLSAIQNLNGGL